MLTLTDRAGHGPYGQFPDHLDRDWLGRWCHLSEADTTLINKRRTPTTRLGFACQLVTVRAIGTFLTDPDQTPAPIVDIIATQLEIDDPGLITGYAKLPVRWKHTTEIRDRYGYSEFSKGTNQPTLSRWLFRAAWNDDLGPNALLQAAHTWLVNRRVLLPGEEILTRLIGSVRQRATRRLHQRLVSLADPALIDRLETMLTVPTGARRSELDRLRRPPTNPSINGLIQALDRLDEVTALGASGLDLSRLPARRVTDLARYADNAWVTQLQDLAPLRRSATLIAFSHILARSARDDVIDVFDRVFGDLQRAAKHRGQKRRTSELRTYDGAVSQLQQATRSVLDAIDDHEAIDTAMDSIRADRAVLDTAMATVTGLMRSPSDPFHDRLVALYPQIRKFLPRLIEAIRFEATETNRPVLEALDALHAWHIDKPRTPRLDESEVPLGIVNKAWEPYVRNSHDATINRSAYACCALDQLRAGLRRRDIYSQQSFRWGDPRAELLPEATWETQRAQACEELALDTDPNNTAAVLTKTLNQKWCQVADNYASNQHFRVTERDGVDRVVVTPLDANPKPVSLLELDRMVDALMPEVEIADVPMEVHSWTGMFDEFSHIGGPMNRSQDLNESLAALLVADACNVGLKPVVDENRPALSRDRLNWVAQNYVRSGTHAAASTRLSNYQAAQPLAKAWANGHMASADGMRLVIPVSTIHAGYNPRYFGRQRGSTLYTWMADTHSSFHQTLIPGTQRDSLYTLDGLIGNHTSIRPDTVSTDTAGASEIVFALAWTLGYRYAPRLADLGDHRLSFIDPAADYGLLSGLARNKINTGLIAGEWDQICRLTASIEAGTVAPSTIMRTLQRGPNPSTLAKALVELGRVIKTLHILTYCDDAVYRRDIQRILNRGEGRNGLARDVFHGQLGKLRQRYQTGQENQLGALGLMVNTIVCWNTVYIQAALQHLTDEGVVIDPADVERLSPLGHESINLQGRYGTTRRAPAGKLRPLRNTV